MDITAFEEKAKWVRREVLETIISARKGHIGGALSCVDLLVALYYGGVLRFDIERPEWSKRDRFILSKGHSCVALYVILADLGFFHFAELRSLGQNGSKFGNHPDKNIPGVEADTGSLGHGLAIGTGFALNAKIEKMDYLTVVMLGDGECYEGSVWEAAMFANHHRLDNLVAIIDRNGQCATDYTEECNRLDVMENIWAGLGWDVIIINGHLFKEIISGFEKIRRRDSGRPLAIIANTIKGKGVSFMERKIKWHHGIPVGRELEIARHELNCSD